MVSLRCIVSDLAELCRGGFRFSIFLQFQVTFTEQTLVKSLDLWIELYV